MQHLQYKSPRCNIKIAGPFAPATSAFIHRTTAHFISLFCYPHPYKNRSPQLITPPRFAPFYRTLSPLISVHKALAVAKQHDKQFKLDTVQYYQDHKDLGVHGCAENLGIGYSTLTKWLKNFRESGDIPVRGSGNYASDEQKEIARLRRELRDAQDALDVLKKAINILGK